MTAPSPVRPFPKSHILIISGFAAVNIITLAFVSEGAYVKSASASEGGVPSWGFSFLQEHKASKKTTVAMLKKGVLSFFIML